MSLMVDWTCRERTSVRSFDAARQMPPVSRTLKRKGFQFTCAQRGLLASREKNKPKEERTCRSPAGQLLCRGELKRNGMLFNRPEVFFLSLLV
jgi:hypothetical protein